MVISLIDIFNGNIFFAIILFINFHLATLISHAFQSFLFVIRIFFGMVPNIFPHFMVKILLQLFTAQHLIVFFNFALELMIVITMNKLFNKERNYIHKYELLTWNIIVMLYTNRDKRVDSPDWLSIRNLTFTQYFSYKLNIIYLPPTVQIIVLFLFNQFCFYIFKNYLLNTYIICKNISWIVFFQCNTCIAWSFIHAYCFLYKFSLNFYN